MRSEDEHQGPVDGQAYRELRLLSEVEETPTVSQRELSQRVGIALGLTNTLLRNLVEKGYVRASQAGWKRWIYSLTPEGFSHKVRLTLAYIHRFMDHYQNVRRTLREQLEPLPLNQESRVAIYGTGEFAELVYLGLREMGIEEIDVYGPAGPNGRRFLGMPVRDLAALQPEGYDRIMIALLADAEATCEELRQRGALPGRVITFFQDGRGGEDK